MTTIVKTQNQLPNEIFCEIISYLPHEEKRKATGISKNLQKILESTFRKEIAEARQSALLEEKSNDSILFFLRGKRIYALSHKHFFKSATIADRCHHYLHLNNLALAHLFYQKLQEQCKQNGGQLPLLENLPPVTQAIRDKLRNQEFVVESDCGKLLPWGIAYSLAPHIIGRISNRVVSLSYNKYEMTNHREAGDDGFIMSKSFINLVLSTFVCSTLDIVVSDPNLTKASSLKGRLICLLHSALHTAFIVPTMVITPLLVIAGGIAALYQQGITGNLLGRLFLALPVYTVLWPLWQITSAIKHLAGAIIHPAIILDHGITPRSETSWIASQFDTPAAG